MCKPTRVQLALALALVVPPARLLARIRPLGWGGGGGGGGTLLPVSGGWPAQADTEAHCLLGAERALQLLDCLFIALQTKLVSRMCTIIIQKGEGGGFGPWIPGPEVSEADNLPLINLISDTINQESGQINGDR